MQHAAFKSDGRRMDNRKGDRRDTPTRAEFLQDSIWWRYHLAGSHQMTLDSIHQLSTAHPYDHDFMLSVLRHTAAVSARTLQVSPTWCHRFALITGTAYRVVPCLKQAYHKQNVAVSFPSQKQVRKSPSSVEVQAIYYIMEGVIYQAPTVQKLIKSRLNKFTHHLNNAFGEAGLQPDWSFHS